MATICGSVKHALLFAIDNTVKKPGQWAVLGSIYLAAAVFIALGVFSVSTPVLMMSFPELQQRLSAEMVSALTAGSISGGIILFIISLNPLLLLSSVAVRILGRKNPGLDGFAKSLLRGAQWWAICLIYSLPLLLIGGLSLIPIASLVSAESLDSLRQAEAGMRLIDESVRGAAVPFGLWIAVVVILLCATCIFLIPALINFARKDDFSKAFAFREIFMMVCAAKWYKILLGLILTVFLGVVLNTAVSMLCIILSLGIGHIPFAGPIFAVILTFAASAAAVIFSLFFQLGYWADFIE